MDSTERIFCLACGVVGVKKRDKKAILGLLSPLKHKDAATHVHYLHSLRTGMVARDIGRFVGLEERPLLMAGALHDCGKCGILLQVLGKTEGWTGKDTKAIKRHVMDGYRMLRGRFDFSAEIMVRHHWFQKDGYPKRLPKFMHPYSEASKALIAKCARVIALADVYDALHRVNDKFGEKRALSRKEIKDLMFKLNPDKKKLIAQLYAAQIFSM